MTRYIKREDAFKTLLEQCKITGYGGLTPADVKFAFSNIPNADVRENVHAHWVRPTIINGRSFDILHCSACGGVPCGVDKSTKFCAYCGAIMDGGDDE